MSWQIVKFGEVSHLINGKAFKPSDWSLEGLPIIRIQNLNDATKPFNYWNGSLDKQVLVQKGDVLLAWSGTPGTSFGAHIWNGGNSVLNQHIFLVKLNPNKITKKWAVIAVNYKLNRLIDQAHGGVGLQHVTKPMVENLEIPLPPLSEQKRIVEVLDKADALRKKRRLVLQTLDVLLQSVFLEMFGDPVKNPKGFPKIKINQISTRITKGESPNWQGFGYEEYGVRFVTSENVGWGKILIKNDKFISNEFNHKIRRSQIVESDLLINLVGASIGRAAIATAEILPANVNQAVAVVTLDKGKAIPSFVLEQILNDSIQKVLTGKIVEAARANISLKNVGDLEILFPAMEMQEKFCKIRNRISKLIQMQNKALIQIENLFQSLQQKAFKGELFNDEIPIVAPQEEKNLWHQTSLF